MKQRRLVESPRDIYVWAIVLQAIPQVIQLVSTVILMRLLSPHAYGLVGVSTLFALLAQSLSECGLSAAVVQKRTLDADDVVSACAANLFLSLVFSTFLWLGAGWLTRFYGMNGLLPVFRWQSVSVFFAALGVVPVALLSRALRLRCLAVVTSLAAFCSAFVSILLAWKFCMGAVSLIVGVAFGSAVTVVGAMLCCDWPKGGRVRLVNLRALLGYGLAWMAGNCVNMIHNNLFAAVMGRFFTAADVGVYARAVRLYHIPLDTIVGVVSKVSFPIFSHLQESPSALLFILRRQIRLVLFFATGSLFALAVTAEDLVTLLLTDKWLPVVPYLRILILGTLMTPASGLLILLVNATGHPKLNLAMECLKALLTLTTVLLLYPYGLMTLVCGGAGLLLITYCLDAWAGYHCGRYAFKDQLYDALPVAGLSAVAVMLAMGSAWFMKVGWGRLLVSLTVYGTVFLLVAMAGRRRVFADAWAVFVWTGKRVSLYICPQKS